MQILKRSLENPPPNLTFWPKGAPKHCNKHKAKNLVVSPALKENPSNLEHGYYFDQDHNCYFYYVDSLNKDQYYYYYCIDKDNNHYNIDEKGAYILVSPPNPNSTENSDTNDNNCDDRDLITDFSCDCKRCRKSVAKQQKMQQWQLHRKEDIEKKSRQLFFWAIRFNEKNSRPKSNTSSRKFSRFGLTSRENMHSFKLNKS